MDDGHQAQTEEMDIAPKEGGQTGGMQGLIRCDGDKSLGGCVAIIRIVIVWGYPRCTD